MSTILRLFSLFSSIFRHDFYHSLVWYHFFCMSEARNFDALETVQEAAEVPGVKRNQFVGKMWANFDHSKIGGFLWISSAKRWIYDDFMMILYGFLWI